jgi:hypothetical protein
MIITTESHRQRVAVGNMPFYDTLKLMQGISLRLPKGFRKFTPVRVRVVRLARPGRQR